MSLCPNWMVTMVLRAFATSPRMAARDIFQKLIPFSQCTRYCDTSCSPIRHERSCGRSVVGRVDTRRSRRKGRYITCQR